MITVVACFFQGIGGYVLCGAHMLHESHTQEGTTAAAGVALWGLPLTALGVLCFVLTGPLAIYLWVIIAFALFVTIFLVRTNLPSLAGI